LNLRNGPPWAWLSEDAVKTLLLTVLIGFGLTMLAWGKGFSIADSASDVQGSGQIDMNVAN